MTAWPEDYKDGFGIITWYINNGYLADFLDEFAIDNIGEMIFNKATGRYEILFMPNESWPVTVVEQAYQTAMYLQNQDIDGNYLIEGRPVSASIRAIGGCEFYEWKEEMQCEKLKEEYMGVL